MKLGEILSPCVTFGIKTEGAEIDLRFGYLTKYSIPKELPNLSSVNSEDYPLKDLEEMTDIAARDALKSLQSTRKTEYGIIVNPQLTIKCYDKGNLEVLCVITLDELNNLPPGQRKEYLQSALNTCAIVQLIYTDDSDEIAEIVIPENGMEGYTSDGLSALGLCSFIGSVPHAIKNGPNVCLTAYKIHDLPNAKLVPAEGADYYDIITDFEAQTGYNLQAKDREQLLKNIGLTGAKALAKAPPTPSPRQVPPAARPLALPPSTSAAAPSPRTVPTPRSTASPQTKPSLFGRLFGSGNKVQ